jgi:hypothetical protein
LQVLLNQEAAPVEAVCAYIYDVLYSILSFEKRYLTWY